MSGMLRCSVVLGLVSLFCLAQSPISQSTPAGETRNSSQSTAAQNQSISSEAPPVASAPAGDPVGEAASLCRKGNFDGAIAKYRELLQEKPRSPDAYAGLIRAYLHQKKVDQAAQTADEALTLVESPRVRVAYAEVLFRQGKIEQAEVEWAKAINAGFPEARAYLGLARVRNACAMYKSAQGMITRAHELDTDDPDIEELWVASLSRAQRIKYLESALAGQNNWDNDKRQQLSGYLQYLKEQANAKYRPCLLSGNATAAEIPLIMILGEDTLMSGWGLPVFLNGHKVSLEIDTGASGIVLGRKAAERAGLAKIVPTKIGGIGDKGNRNGYFGIADSIQIGDMEFEGCPIQILQDRSVVGHDGLIGADVFQDFLVDLDFPSALLRLSALPKRPGEAERKPALTNDEDNPDDSAPQDSYIAPEMQSFTRVLRFGHDLLVPTTIGTVHKFFLLDTGAFDNAISPAAAREVTKMHNSGTVVKGISGSVKKVYSANKVELHFGHLRQKNQDMIAFDTSELSNDDGTEVSGFLGFKLLSLIDIKIDYRDALVDFSYDPNRWK